MLNSLLLAAVDVVAPVPRITTVQQRWAIIALHEDHQSNRMIALKLDLHRDTVKKWIDEYRLTGDVKDRRRIGRPRLTDESTDTNITLTALVEKFTSPRQIKRSLELDASARTIDRRLQEAGLVGRVARHKRDYTEVEVRKRLSFANGYSDKDEEWWESVLFSDEKCFYGRGFCGRTWVRRPIGEALNPEYCVHKTAHPVKVNVWVCFCASGQGYMYIFNETMDASLFKRILADNLIPSARLHFPSDPPQQWYLLHDNDRKITGGVVSELLYRSGFTCIDFLPYSPDLNPMENLWATMASACENQQLDTIEEL